MPSHDTLYLLKPDFMDPNRGNIRYLCRECVEVAGLFEYYPQLWSHVHVRYVEFQRPRAELAALIGEENQGCPVLVLGDDTSADLPSRPGVQRAHGRAFVAGAENIEAYLAHLHDIGVAY